MRFFFCWFCVFFWREAVAAVTPMVGLPGPGEVSGSRGSAGLVGACLWAEQRV